MFLSSATILHPKWSFQNTNLMMSPSVKNFHWFLIVFRKKDRPLLWPESFYVICFWLICRLTSLPSQPCSMLIWIDFCQFFEQIIFFPSLGPLHMLFAGMFFPAKLPTTLPYFLTSPLPSLDYPSFRSQIKYHYFKETYFDPSNIVGMFYFSF